MFIIKPNPGAQEQFLRSSADITIYGGSRGGGKTWGLLMNHIRYKDVKGFQSTIFRKTYPQIESAGGLWDKSLEIFPYAGAKGNQSSLKWKFGDTSTCKFAHMALERDKDNIQGGANAYIGVDEGTHFSWGQFTAMIANNRSTCGVKPFICVTCNPDPSSWLADFLSPWIGDDGYVREGESGKVRYFTMGEKVVWHDTRDPIDGIEPISVKFISADLWDNPVLMEKDPSYLKKLQSLPLVERERFLGIKGRGGNWKIKAEAGTIFNRDWFQLAAPPPISPGDRLVRYWDLAAMTQKNAKSGDFNVGLLLHHVESSGDYWIREVTRRKLAPAETNQLICQKAAEDGRSVLIRWQQDPGAAGVRDSINLQRLLTGFNAKGESEMRDKVSRALPCSYAAEVGRVKIAIAPWNQAFLAEAENFPESKHDDQIDGLSGAFNILSKPNAAWGQIRI